MTKNRFCLPSFFMIGITSFAGAFAFASTRTEVTLQQVCAYDKYCRRLDIRTDGSIILPRPEILKILGELKLEIHETAKKFDIDPVVIAASILAENTMNITVTDRVQNWLVANSITPSGNVLGRSFSVGLGQIKTETAEEADPVVAKIENRPVITDRGKIAETLVTPQGSLTYNAAIIKQATDAYQAIGVDISKRPVIQATLYNLGKVPSRSSELAAARKRAEQAAGPLPDAKPNYFGYFVGHYYDLVAKTIGTPEEAQKLSEEKNLVSAVETPVVLQKLMPLCDPNKGGVNQNGLSVQGSGTFRVLARDLDCDMTPFSLVEFENGVTGWILSERLDHFSVKVKRSRKTCKTLNPEQCVRELSQSGTIQIDEMSALSDIESGVLLGFARAYGSKVTSSLRSSIPATGIPELLSSEQRAAILRRFSDLKDEVVKRLNLTSWEDSSNAYRASFNWIQSLQNCQKDCVVSGVSLNSLSSTLESFLYQLRRQSAAPPSEKSLEKIKATQIRPLKENPEITRVSQLYQSECGPLVEHIRKRQTSEFLYNGESNFIDPYQRLFHGLKRFHTVESFEKTKHWKQMVLLLDEIRQSCRSYSSCSSRSISDPISGTRCKLDRDFKNVEPFCDVIERNSMLLATSKSRELLCYLIRAESDAPTCDYDFELLAERLQSISKIGCVKQVIVPDRNAIALAIAEDEKTRSKIVYGNLLRDRVMILIRQECTAEKP